MNTQNSLLKILGILIALGLVGYWMYTQRSFAFFLIFLGVIVGIILLALLPILLIARSMSGPKEEEVVKHIKSFLGYDFGQNYQILDYSYDLRGEICLVLLFQDNNEWHKLVEYCESLNDGEDDNLTIRHETYIYNYQSRNVQKRNKAFQINFQYNQDREDNEPLHRSLKIDYAARTLIYNEYSIS